MGADIVAECTIPTCNDLSTTDSINYEVLNSNTVPKVNIPGWSNPLARIGLPDFEICPPNLPYAFLYGLWCCQNNVEENWEESTGVIMLDCNGGPLEYPSVCCLGVYERCAVEPCLSHPSVSDIGAAEFITRPPEPMYTASGDGVMQFEYTEASRDWLMQYQWSEY